MAMTALGVEGLAQADVKILATDISVDTLRQATEGRYAGPRLDPVPEGLRRRFFTRLPGASDPDGELWEVRPEVKALVTYRRLNLAEPPFPMKGPLDVVFCRNVLIYFDQATRQRLVSAMEELLRPGGLLCIGHTETLSGLRSKLKMQRPSVFRRPEEHSS